MCKDTKVLSQQNLFVMCLHSEKLNGEKGFFSMEQIKIFLALVGGSKKLSKNWWKEQAEYKVNEMVEDITESDMAKHCMFIPCL